MALSKLHFFLLMSFCASNFLQATPRSLPTVDYYENQVALYVFGDSFYDFGTNNYLDPALGHANVKPYGETFFNYSSGRVTDGRNMADFIAAYLKLPLIVPYLLPGYHRFTDGVNFAAANAGALVETNEGLVISFKAQLEQFKEVKTKLKELIGEEKTHSVLNKALFMISIATVDYQSYFLTNKVPDEEYINKVVGNITAGLHEMYKLGGRKFGMLNLVRMGCTPLLRAVAHKQNKTGCLGQANEVAELHNKKLYEALQKIQVKLKGFEYSYFDFYNTLWKRMESPSNYGFKYGDKLACCGSGIYRGTLSCGNGDFEVCENPNDFVHFDSVHPTDKAYEQLAKLMWNGSAPDVYPQNIRRMIGII